MEKKLSKFFMRYLDMFNTNLNQQKVIKDLMSIINHSDTIDILLGPDDAPQNDKPYPQTLVVLENT